MTQHGHPGAHSVAAVLGPQGLNRAWKVDVAGVVALGALSLGGYLAGLGPYLGAKVDKARHDIAMSDATRDREEARADTERFSAVLAGLREETKSIEVELQPFSHKHVQVGNIARLAAESFLLVDQVSPSSPVAIAGVAAVVKVPIILTGKGSYEQISEFLRGIDEQFKDTAVESVRLLAEPSTDGAKATFSVTLHWYARPDIPS